MESVYLTKDKASMPIVIDIGASHSISPCISDFIELKESRWNVTDQNGTAMKQQPTTFTVPLFTYILLCITLERAVEVNSKWTTLDYILLPCRTIVASQPCHPLSTPSIIY